ncbi:1-aminocyclopropane-1-carboxylate oxidase homolog 1-like [Olea europaea var. sylvestris]|uniref:1-aminocyclopropane-1-carboxylate oxidase homolog 1-like n=1 Tax=Olea europaea var. sylvestris TaxID=158386 RepID=UPI000C1D6E3F|nr:1-aminocyclopropane-1-carboxylate oxidase homolog 1-like [Olea europaea var. sylvestris]
MDLGAPWHPSRRDARLKHQAKWLGALFGGQRIQSLVSEDTKDKLDEEEDIKLEFDKEVVLEEMFNYFSKIGELIESILNDFLGLPPDFLKKYNRRWDILTTRRYFPATGNDNIGLSQHTDGNCITFIFQDEVGALEVLKDGEWTPIVLVEGTILVNVGDVIQVLKTIQECSSKS